MSEVPTVPLRVVLPSLADVLEVIPGPPPRSLCPGRCDARGGGPDLTLTGRRDTPMSRRPVRSSPFPDITLPFIAAAAPRAVGAVGTAGSASVSGDVLIPPPVHPWRGQ